MVRSGVLKTTAEVWRTPPGRVPPAPVDDKGRTSSACATRLQTLLCHFPFRGTSRLAKLSEAFVRASRRMRCTLSAILARPRLTVEPLS
jgi:hypothetical protein